MGSLTRARRLALAAVLASGCSAFGPDDREHRYDLRVSADRTTSIDYEIEMFADRDGVPVRVSALFRREVTIGSSRQELNEVAISSPGYLGVRVEGARVERLVVGSAGGAVTVELLVDGEVKRRAVVEGAGATITDLRVGKTW